MLGNVSELDKTAQKALVWAEKCVNITLSLRWGERNPFNRSQKHKKRALESSRNSKKRYFWANNKKERRKAAEYN